MYYLAWIQKFNHKTSFRLKILYTILFISGVLVFVVPRDMQIARSAVGVLVHQNPTSTPDYAGASQKYGQAIKYVDAGNYVGALPLLNDAVALNPNDEIAWETLAEVHWELQQYEDAVAAALTALGISEDLPHAWNILGAAHLELGMCEQAVIEFQKSIALDDQNPNAYSNLGSCYLELNRFQDALVAFDSAIELDSGDATLFYNRGNVYRDMGDCERALQDYETALSMSQSDADLYNNRANCFQTLGQYEQAVDSINKAIEKRPSAQFYTNKAEYLIDLGDYEAAFSAAMEALQFDDDYALAYRALGNIYFHKQMYREAIESYRAGSELDPNNMSIWRNLGVALYVSERYEEAAQAWEVVISHGSSSSEYIDVLNYLAFVYADKLGVKLDRAIALAQEAISLARSEEERGEFLDTLAWAYFKLGQCQEALDAVTQAQTLVQDNAEIQQHASEIQKDCS